MTLWNTADSRSVALHLAARFAGGASVRASVGPRCLGVLRLVEGVGSAGGGVLLGVDGLVRVSVSAHGGETCRRAGDTPTMTRQ